MPLYLRLFHGRADPSDILTDWGTDGPTLGPFDTFHVAYFATLDLHRDDVTFSLSTTDSLIHFDHIFYGDFEILDAPPAGPVLSLEDAERRTHPADAVSSHRETAAPLVNVFLDAIRSTLGDELARRLDLALTAALR